MPRKAIDLIANGTPWAITEDMLNTIISIAERKNDIEAVLAERGRPLDNTRTVTIIDDKAIIPIHGAIIPRANLFSEISGAVSVETLAQDFNAADKNPNVNTIVLDMATPGGNVAGINEFSQLVRDSKTATVGFVGEMAASAGFWIVSACDTVVIDSTGAVGSVGVVTSRFTGDDDGVIEIVSSRAPDKRLDVDTEEGRAVIQANLDKLEDVFVQTISENMSLSVEDIVSHRGGILIGSDAVEAGFADEIGSMQTILAGNSGNFKIQRGVNMAGAKDNIPEITQAYISENYPDIAQTFRKEGEQSATETLDSLIAEAKVEGAGAERARIQAVEENNMVGHEDLIQSMKFDGKTTGEQAAVAVLKAEKGLRAKSADSFKSDTPPPVPTDVSDSDSADQEDTFDSLVDAGIKSGLTRAQAISAAVKQSPELHKQWLGRINSQSKGAS